MDSVHTFSNERQASCRSCSVSGRVLTQRTDRVLFQQPKVKSTSRSWLKTDSPVNDEARLGPQTQELRLTCPTRRKVLQMGSAMGTAMFSPRSSQAINMPQAFDNAWSAIGGGPADLSFPEEFLGLWKAESTLVNVETPLGPSFVPNIQVVDRAKREDLKQKIRYEVAYIRNKKGKVIIDRAFNTSSLMNVYMGRGAIEQQGVSWNPEDPNRLSVHLPGGLDIVTRVVRRSEERPGSDRIYTSEFFEQVFQTAGRVEPKVKASQCFTKYKWRSQAEAAKTGGPAIVATQVVSDYLTPYDGEGMMLRAKNRPVVVYTYNMAFRRSVGSFQA